MRGINNLVSLQRWRRLGHLIRTSGACRKEETLVFGSVSAFIRRKCCSVFQNKSTFKGRLFLFLEVVKSKDVRGKRDVIKMMTSRIFRPFFYLFFTNKIRVNLDNSLKTRCQNSPEVFS